MNKPVKYNTTVTGMYRLSNGSFWSIDLDAKAYDALQTAKVGDKLLFKPVSEGTKEAKGERFPDGFIEIISKEKLKTFPQSSRSGTKAATGTPKRSSKSAPQETQGDASGDDWG